MLPAPRLTGPQQVRLQAHHAAAHRLLAATPAAVLQRHLRLRPDPVPAAVLLADLTRQRRRPRTGEMTLADAVDVLRLLGQNPSASCSAAGASPDPGSNVA